MKCRRRQAHCQPPKKKQTKETLKSYFSVNDTVNAINLDPYYKVIVIIPLCCIVTRRKISYECGLLFKAAEVCQNVLQTLW